MFERVDAALRIIASFSGLAQENMSQLAGWRFLELGRRIERAIATCRFVRQFADGDALDGALDVLLELADSQITYRQRYVMVAARAPVIDLVVLDPEQSALGRLPARPHRDASRGVAQASAPTAGCRRRSRSRRRSRPGCARRTRRAIDDALIVAIEDSADAAVRDDRRGLSHAQRALRSRAGRRSA